MLRSLLFSRGSCELPESGRFSRCTKCITHVRPSGRDSADRVTFPCRNRPGSRGGKRGHASVQHLSGVKRFFHLLLHSLILLSFPSNTDPDRLASKSRRVEPLHLTILQGGRKRIRQQVLRVGAMFTDSAHPILNQVSDSDTAIIRSLSGSMSHGRQVCVRVTRSLASHGIGNAEAHLTSTPTATDSADAAEKRSKRLDLP